MIKYKLINYLSNNMESDYLIKLIDVLFVPVIVLIFGFSLYYLFKLINKKIIENKYHKMYASSGIDEIDKMDGLQFEHYLKALFKELGYKSEVTKGSNDFGADLIIKKDSEKTVIQAKRYKYKNHVSIDAVQQIYTAIPYYKANSGWIITNSQYTKSAEKLASVTNVKLIDRYKLVNFINEIKPSITPTEVKKIIQPKARKCPECKNDLIIRRSKAGNEFFGCSNYPTCKHTESIAN